MQDLNELAQRIYKQNCDVGWWDDPNPCLYTKFQLISTEIAEATEGERKNLMDDHLPHRKMGEVELADALIRTLDLGAHLGLEVYNTGDWITYNLQEWSVGRKHLWLNELVIEFCSDHFNRGTDPKWYTEIEYTRLLDGVIAVADSLGYDIMSAVEEKIAYNLQRSVDGDHSRENREKENGKKF